MKRGLKNIATGGSLRARSSNAALLRAAVAVAPAGIAGLTADEFRDLP